MDKRMIITAACALIMLSGCTKQSLETTYSNQEDKIDSYISSLTKENPDYTVVHNNGSNRITMGRSTEEPGPALAEGGTVSFYFAGYTFSSNISANNLFATNNQDFAEENGWTVTDPDYSIKTVRLSKDELLEGLYYGLEGVRARDTCLIIFSGKYGFGKKHIGTIPANSALAFQIWVERVSE